MNINYANIMKDEVHQANIDAGWWHSLDDTERKPENKLERNPAELLALIHSEVSEAYEAWCSGKNDDKLPHRNGEEVELADTLIRLFDMAGGFDVNFINVDNEDMRESIWKNIPAEHLETIFYNTLHHSISQTLECFRKNKTDLYDDAFSKIYTLIIFYSQRKELNIQEAIQEKLEFNRNRADHKPENRKKAGGKKI